MNKRQKQILDLVSQERELGVQDMVARLKASEATIRRDLAYLEKEKLVIRTFGGARIVDEFSKVAQSFQARVEKNRQQKNLIAKEAALYVEPGMVIAIDNGTTTWMITQYIRDVSPLTVVSNSLQVVQSLFDVPGIDIYCTGGRFRERNNDFVGSTALSTYKKWHTDLSFISGDSMEPTHGVYKFEEESAMIIDAMTRSTNQSIVLVDSTKYLSRKASFLALEAEKINLLLTDNNPDCPGDLFAGCGYTVKLLN